MLHYQNQQLYCEQLPLAALAEAVGTPAYIYSKNMLLSLAAQSQPGNPNRLVCFAVKANGNVTLMKHLRDIGCGADVTSGGELFLALQAGFSPEKIIFSGVGKTDADIEAALDANILALHVESSQELHRIQNIAARRQQKTRIGVRVNPDIAVDTHPYIGTGQKQHKFGVSPETAVSLLHAAAAHPWLEPVGLATHIGSQITSLAPFSAAAKFLVQLADETASVGIQLKYLDVGGGLGIDYTGEPVPSIEAWTTAVSTPIQASGYDIVMELGRSIVGPAGVLLTQVVYTKDSGRRHFAIVDAGMNDLLRPTLYQAHHPMLPVQAPTANTPRISYDVVGPVCESGDWLAKGRELPLLRSGDLLAVTHCGAYGFSMGSNYNGRLLPPEILVEGSEWTTIRQRQTLSDLL